jgi:hypothetical protein
MLFIRGGDQKIINGQSASFEFVAKYQGFHFCSMDSAGKELAVILLIVMGRLVVVDGAGVT